MSSSRRQFHASPSKPTKSSADNGKSFMVIGFSTVGVWTQLLYRDKIDLHFASECFRGAVEGGQGHRSIRGIEKTIQGGARGPHSSGHGSFVRFLLVHQVGDLHGDSALQGG